MCFCSSKTISLEIFLELPEFPFHFSFKIWQYTGSLLHETEEFWEACLVAACLDGICRTGHVIPGGLLNLHQVVSQFLVDKILLNLKLILKRAQDLKQIPNIELQMKIKKITNTKLKHCHVNYLSFALLLLISDFTSEKHLRSKGLKLFLSFSIDENLNIQGQFSSFVLEPKTQNSCNIPI